MKPETDIATIIKDLSRRKRIVLARSEEELRFLRQWTDRSSAGGIPRTRDELDALIMGCRRCSESGERKLGYGTGTNGLMIVLNTPRLISPTEMRLFKSESADLLRKMIGAMNVDFDQCYITNVIKCETEVPNNVEKLFRECASLMRMEIAFFHPRIVLVMGEIVTLQKIISESSALSWFNVEHPLTLLKNTDLKRSAWNTLQLIMARMREPDMR